MSSYGLGIGSFMSGLSRGMSAGSSIGRQDLQDEIAARRLKLAEDMATREAENDKQDRAWKTEDRAYLGTQRQRADEEYSANKPLVDIERKTKLGVYQDAEELKNTKSAAAADAKAALAQNPDKYTSFDDAYTAVAVPKLREYYLSKGDTAGADGLDSWGKNAQIKEGKKAFGGFLQAFQTGDLDAATKHINDMVHNDTYFSKFGRNITSEQLKDEKGNVAGLRLKMKDPEGKEFTRDFTTPEQIFEFGSSALSPDSMYELMRADNEAAKAGKAKQAELLGQTRKEIAVEEAKTEGKLLEKAAEGGTKENPGTKTRADIFKSLMETDPAFAKRPPDQQAQIVNQQYEALNNPTTPRSIFRPGSTATPGSTTPTRPPLPLVSRP